MQVKPITQLQWAYMLASPETCATLRLLGITAKTTFVWKVDSNQIKPWSYKFDPDGYYEQGDKNFQSIGQCSIIPAYSIAELQYVFSFYNYTLVREGKAVQLVIDTPIKTTVIAESEPDAFASALIQVINEGMITIEAVNACIASSNNYSSG